MGVSFHENINNPPANAPAGLEASEGKYPPRGGIYFPSQATLAEPIWQACCKKSRFWTAFAASDPLSGRKVAVGGRWLGGVWYLQRLRAGDGDRRVSGLLPFDDLYTAIYRFAAATTACDRI